MQMTGGQALAQSLKIEGIETLFALPGIQLDFLFDGIWEERDHFKVIHTRHEQATAYMADGFARTTGKIGTSIVVPGPGLLNAAAALSTAYACSSPVLMVTMSLRYSTGSPNPKIALTVATMMTSSRSIRLDVARSRRASMSSLMVASFSMYVSVAAMYASG